MGEPGGGKRVRVLTSNFSNRRSFGCVLAEMLLSRPLFPADNSPMQMKTIAKVLGSPNVASIIGMRVRESNRALAAAREFRGRVEGWEVLRRHKAPVEAADLLSQLLVYKPGRRLGALECLAHPFFDSLRETAELHRGGAGQGKVLPSLFDFAPDEIEAAREAGVLEKILVRALTLAV